MIRSPWYPAWSGDSGVAPKKSMRFRPMVAPWIVMKTAGNFSHSIKIFYVDQHVRIVETC